jgi:DNA-binding MarR family transcriptional regulator
VNGTRWLDDDEQRAWRALAGVMTRLPAVLDSQLQRDAGLTHFAYWVLAMLSEAPGRALRMSELAARSNSSPSRLSHVVARLEREGWVHREPTGDDARGSVAVLTESGWDKVVATAPGHVAAVRTAVFDRLSRAQVAQLERIGGAVLAGLDEHRRVGPG